MQRAWSKIILAFSFLSFLLLAGCLEQLNQFSLQGNDSRPVNPSGLNASASPSAAAPQIAFPPNASQAGQQVEEQIQQLVPGNASVCIYGEQDERFSGNAFGNLSVFGKNVVLWAKWLDSNSTARNASSLFGDCAAIIVLGDNEGKFVERSVREAIARQVSRGAGLVVSGEGGAYSAEDSSVFGWELGFDTLVPATISSPGKDARPLGKRVLSGEFATTRGDPALRGVDSFLFDQWLVVQSLSTDGGEVIAVVREGQQGASANRPSFPAVIRSRENPLKNAVYYFAFDARDAPQVFVNTARFVSSEYFKFLLLRAG